MKKKEEKKRPREELGKAKGELGEMEERWEREEEKKRRRAGGEKKEEAVIPRPSNNFHPLLTAFSASLEPSRPYFLSIRGILPILPQTPYSCGLYESNPCCDISIKHRYPIYILLERKNIIKVDIAMLTTRNTAR